MTHTPKYPTLEISRKVRVKGFKRVFYINQLTKRQDNADQEFWDVGYWDGRKKCHVVISCSVHDMLPVKGEEYYIKFRPHYDVACSHCQKNHEIEINLLQKMGIAHLGLLDCECGGQSDLSLNIFSQTMTAVPYDGRPLNYALLAA